LGQELEELLQLVSPVIDPEIYASE